MRSSQNFTVRVPKCRCISILRLAENNHLGFCKLAIFFVVMGFSKCFTISVPKCHSDDKKSKTN